MIDDILPYSLVQYSYMSPVFIHFLGKSKESRPLLEAAMDVTAKPS